LGDEARAAGDPVVAVDGSLVLDDDGNVVLNTASTITATKRERFGFGPGSTTTRLLEQVPLGGLAVVIAGRVLTPGTEYHLDTTDPTHPNRLFIHPTSGPTAFE